MFPSQHASVKLSILEDKGFVVKFKFTEAVLLVKPKLLFTT